MLSKDVEYLIDKIIDPNINFFDDHPCKIRPLVGKDVCDKGMYPLAIGTDSCAVLLLKSGSLEMCLKLEKMN